MNVIVVFSPFLAEAYIYKALWLMENELYSASRHHGDRPGVTNLALIVTDSQYPVAYPGPRDAVQIVAQQARDADIGEGCIKPLQETPDVANRHNFLHDLISGSALCSLENTELAI